MKKLLLLISAMVFLFLATSCSKPSFTPNPGKAAGVIIVNGKPEAAEGGRICAEQAEDRFVFPLDSAMVYYFDYDAETIYAGDLPDFFRQYRNKGCRCNCFCRIYSHGREGKHGLRVLSPF